MSIRKLCFLISLVSLVITCALIAIMFLPQTEGIGLLVVVILSGISALITWGTFIAAVTAKPGQVAKDGIFSTIIELLF